MQKIYKILFLFLTAGILVGCSGNAQEAPEAEQVKTVNVKTRIVQPQSFERYLQLVGTVESENDVKLSAEVSGRIERYYVNKGNFVEQGEPILKIDDSKLQKEQARLKAQMVQAREKYHRLKRIFEQDSIGSKMGVINARTTYQQRQAALKSLKVDLRNTTIRAPFSGVVDNKLMEVGEMAAPGTPVVRLLGIGNLKITAGVPARFANVVGTGDKAKVWFDVQAADTLQLPITYVSQSIDTESRTFEVEIELPAEAQNYKVDMKADVKLQTFSRDSAIVVGQEYVYPAEEEFVVYTLAKNDSSEFIANRQTVQLGPSYKNNVVVESGLNFGEELITTGSSFLQDSMRVNVTGNGKKNLTQEN